MRLQHVQLSVEYKMRFLEYPGHSFQYNQSEWGLHGVVKLQNNKKANSCSYLVLKKCIQVTPPPPPPPGLHKLWCLLQDIYIFSLINGRCLSELQTKIRFQTIAQILVWHGRTRNIVHKSFETHLWSFKVLLSAFEAWKPQSWYIVIARKRVKKVRLGSDMRDKNINV